MLPKYHEYQLLKILIRENMWLDSIEWKKNRIFVVYRRIYECAMKNT